MTSTIAARTGIAYRAAFEPDRSPSGVRALLRWHSIRWAYSAILIVARAGVGRLGQAVRGSIVDWDCERFAVDVCSPAPVVSNTCGKWYTMTSPHLPSQATG